MPRDKMHDEAPSTKVPCPAASPAASHDALRLALMDAGRQVSAAADDPDRFPAARDGIARFCFTELLPHLEADESRLLEARHCPPHEALLPCLR